jgi:hypothetical protein
MKYHDIREEELKNKITEDYFSPFDCTKIIGNLDFCVCKRQGENEVSDAESLLWAEAKKGNSDIFKSLVQLILTVGKARIFDKFLPPAFLGAFDAEKMTFIPYNEIHEVFYWNDFNWNVAPSNYQTKEFILLHDKVQTIIEEKSLLFYYENDATELKKFIAENFIVGKTGLTKIRIDKNNFISVYGKWLQSVKPTVAARWDIAKNSGIIDADFYLADLLSEENETIKEKLFVLLKKNQYELERKIDDKGFFNSSRTGFTDGQKAHSQFWNRYERPPKKEFWDYIVERRDLLVPQDIRERKGSFFTPQIWVETAQKYLADVLGEDWQDEYYIWDCAAGTGNLLNGLTNKFHIWASTLDKQDVDVMHDRIANGANLLEEHVFQFDFLNDKFEKLPQGLQNILNDPKKRRKLVIFINPPYAEASDKKTLKTGTMGKKGVEQSDMNKQYAELLGQGNAELFAQFFIRIYKEIPDCMLAEFSKIKILQGQHFILFRNHFLAKLEKLFLIPADTFDNVRGKFPIGFFVWDTSKKEPFLSINADVFGRDGKFLGTKKIESYTDKQYINDWIKPYRADVLQNQLIGKFPFKGNDFQNQNLIQIVHQKMPYNTEAGQFFINQKNVLFACVYFAVRKVIPATWLNDRDQFLFPRDSWVNDTAFQNDCLVYTLFKNNIQSRYGTNHWIPFSEKEINAKTKFESDFMFRYISGKIDTNVSFDLFNKVEKKDIKPLEFSPEARAVFDSGRELWAYYHAQKDINVNASLYDIREFFQGRSEGGRMKNGSEDEKYLKLLTDLRKKLTILANKIEPKVYEHGFLKS